MPEAGSGPRGQHSVSVGGQLQLLLGLDAAACHCSQGTCPRYSGRACGQLCPVSREIYIHDFRLWEKGDDKEFLCSKKYAHEKVENLNEARRKSLGDCPKTQKAVGCSQTDPAALRTHGRRTRGGGTC